MLAERPKQSTHEIAFESERLPERVPEFLLKICSAPAEFV
jgi:hypothetical protein